MKNGYLVHKMRSALIELSQEINGRELWIVGFNSSFVWDNTDIEEAKKYGSYCIKNDCGKTKAQQEEEYRLGFEAGLKLRLAIEESQKEYPKAKSAWDTLKSDPLS